MSRTAIKKLTPMEELFKRLCANKETQKTLLEAIEAERNEAEELARDYAVKALYEEDFRKNAYACIGVFNLWNTIYENVSKF